VQLSSCVFILDSIFPQLPEILPEKNLAKKKRHTSLQKTSPYNSFWLLFNVVSIPLDEFITISLDFDLGKGSFRSLFMAVLGS